MQGINDRIRDGGDGLGLGDNNTRSVDMERGAILLVFCCPFWSSKVVHS